MPLPTLVPVASKTKLGREVVFSILGQKQFEKFLNSFLGFILFQGHISGEKSTKIYVHIGAKENKNIISYMRITHKHLRFSSYTQNKGPLRQFKPNGSPYFPS